MVLVDLSWKKKKKNSPWYLHNFAPAVLRGSSSLRPDESVRVKSTGGQQLARLMSARCERKEKKKNSHAAVEFLNPCQPSRGMLLLVGRRRLTSLIKLFRESCAFIKNVSLCFFFFQFCDVFISRLHRVFLQVTVLFFFLFFLFFQKYLGRTVSLRMPGTRQCYYGKPSSKARRRRKTKRWNKSRAPRRPPATRPLFFFIFSAVYNNNKHSCLV